MGIALVFIIKAFVTGIFLAWGFANGHRLDAWSRERWDDYRDQVLAFFKTWPGLRTWLAMFFAQLIPE